MPSRRPVATLLVLACSLPLVACGNERTPLPDVAGPVARLGDNPLTNAQGGFSLVAPAGWTVAGGEGPLVLTISDGPAIISLWRYPRTEPLPKTREELDRAMGDLIAAAKARDATYTPIKSARSRLDGQPSVTVRATQTVSGLPRTVRSVHAYAFGGEVVVDMMAPNETFRNVDATFFRPLLESMRLTAPTA